VNSYPESVILRLVGGSQVRRRAAEKFEPSKMPKLTTTIVLFVLALGTGAWVLLELDRKPERPKDTGPLLPELRTDRVVRITIDREKTPRKNRRDVPGARERLVFERTKTGWTMLQPVHKPVTQKRIEAFFQGPLSNWPLAYVPVEDPAKFGLGASALRVTFHLPETDRTVLIGTRSLRLRCTYARLEGAKKAALVDYDFARPYEQSVEEYLAK